MTRSPSFPFPSKVDRSANVKAASYVEVKARPQSSAREQRPKRGGSGSGDRRSKVLRGGGAGGTAGAHVPVMLQAPFTAGAAERFAAALASPHDAAVRRLPYGAGRITAAESRHSGLGFRMLMALGLLEGELLYMYRR